MEKTRKSPKRPEDPADPALPVIRGDCPGNRAQDHICRGPVPENRLD